MGNSIIIGKGITWLPLDYCNLRIVSQPVDFTGDIGDDASFTVVAKGSGITYQWMANVPDRGWRNVVNATQPTMTAEITAIRLGYDYKCRITDRFGNHIDTNLVKMVQASNGLTMMYGSYSGDDDMLGDEVIE